MTSADFWWLAVFIAGLLLGLAIFCGALVAKWGRHRNNDTD